MSIETKKTYIGFNPDKIRSYFEGRNWSVETLHQDEVKLVPVTPGAALECGDGRFDQLDDRKANGVRIFGGVNAIMALLTGGDEVGLQRAVDLIERFDAKPGTHSADHGGCGYADLWIAGELDSAKYRYEMQERLKDGGTSLRSLMKEHDGKHFRLNGNHKEEGVRLNPFNLLTEDANDGLRFRIDDWFMAGLGIPDDVRFFKIAETVEKLKPDATGLEIIIP